MGENSIEIEFNGYGEYLVIATAATAPYTNPRYSAPRFEFVTKMFGGVEAQKLADGVWRVYAMRGTMVLEKTRSGFGVAIGCVVIGDWSDDEAPTFS